MRPLAVSLLVLGAVVAGGVGRWSVAWWGGGAEEASASAPAAAARWRASGERATAGDGGAGQGKKAASAEGVAPTPEQLVIEEHALAQVERAIARGRWGDEDRVVLRRLLGGLHREQREAVMRQLVMAVNDGRLQLDPIGPLL